MQETLRNLRLDPGSPVPLYYQLREILRERLEEGRFRPGDSFPTEAEICRASGLSRMTVRHALAELKAQGLIEGRRGAGTVVSVSASRDQLEADSGSPRGRLALKSFTEVFRSQGHVVGGKVLYKGLAVPTDGARRELGLEPGATALVVRRVRSLDGEPVSLETSWYPQPVAGFLLDMDLNDRSIYAILTEAGIVPEEAAEAIELSLLTPREAKALRAIAGIPVALYRRTTYDKEGRPIEFTKVIYRGDRHKFTSRLRRSDLSPERPRD